MPTNKILLLQYCKIVSFKQECTEMVGSWIWDFVSITKTKWVEWDGRNCDALLGHHLGTASWELNSKRSVHHYMHSKEGVSNLWITASL